MSNTRKIMFISADPKDQILETVDWATELKEIAKIFRNGKTRNRYSLDPSPNATPQEFIDCLRENPWLFHFCGHGDKKGNLILENNDNSRSRRTLDREVFLGTVSEQYNLKCVVLCSCNSSLLSEEMEDKVEYTIGFEGTLQNADSIIFTKILYKNFLESETIPHAYQRTIDDLRTTNYGLKGNLKPVFKTKNSFVMNNVILQNDFNMRLRLQQHEKKEVEALEKKVNSVNEELKTLLLELIEENPFPRGVFWFVENKDNLAFEIGKIIKYNEPQRIQERFAGEIDIMFDFLKTSLVSFDYRDFSKEDLKCISKKSKKQEYVKGLDELIKLIPNTIKSTDFEAFFTDNVKYIQSLI